MLPAVAIGIALLLVLLLGRRTEEPVFAVVGPGPEGAKALTELARERMVAQKEITLEAMRQLVTLEDIFSGERVAFRGLEVQERLGLRGLEVQETLGLRGLEVAEKLGLQELQTRLDIARELAQAEIEKTARQASTQLEIARLLAEIQKQQIQAQLEAERAKAAAEQQKGFFGFLSSILGWLFCEPRIHEERVAVYGGTLP